MKVINYLMNAYSESDFDNDNGIWLLLSMATLCCELSYKYDYVAGIMKWILSSKNKTIEHEKTALRWLLASQVVADDEKEMYKKMLNDYCK